jgi:hypothetical protein
MVQNQKKKCLISNGMRQYENFKKSIFLLCKGYPFLTINQRK